MRPPPSPLRHCGPYAITTTALLTAGVVLASHHPTSPALALVGLTVWCLAAWRWDGAWLFALPACLPAASLAPWTGWTAFDEFDLVVLGALSAGHARSAWHCMCARAGTGPPVERVSGPLVAIAWVCAASVLVAVVRAMLAADPLSFDWYDGELDPVNALRVGKSELYALLLLPLLHRQCLLSKADVMRRFAAGMLVGLGIVSLAAVWERTIYPGVFDFSKSYRTVALFWEMHVGGAAIDAYLAMAVPFAVRAVLRSTTPFGFVASALLAVLTEYACLTSFSRGLYVALVGSLIVFALVAVRRRVEVSIPPWRCPANLTLIVVLVGQLIAVVGSDSFMLNRISRGNDDFKSRLAQWSRGIALIHGVSDAWLGKGMGRLPAELARTAPFVLSGRARVVADGEETRLELRGPPSNQALAGLFVMAQRLPPDPTPYRITLDVRADRATTLVVAVCEVHLLYEGECRRAFAEVAASGRQWQHLTLALEGSQRSAAAMLPRSAVFSIGLARAGGVVELDHLAMVGAGAGNVLRNADFADKLARWYPMAKDYFIPWHIDSLALELLIEQGIVGMAVFGWLMSAAFAALLSRRCLMAPPADQVEPVLAASLAAGLSVGLVSSVLDMPRVAFVLFFLAFLSLQLAQESLSGPLRRGGPSVGKWPKARHSARLPAAGAISARLKPTEMRLSEHPGSGRCVRTFRRYA